jgi:hypothetical protein
MPKELRERKAPAVPPPSRRRRGPLESNNRFLKAFADALRDILRDERRRAA